MDTASYVGFVIIITIFAIGMGILSQQSHEDKITPWQSLAAAKKLTFIPGSWSPFGSSSAFVQGVYRDCHLTLTTAQRNPNKSSTYTEVSVRPEKRMKGQVSSEKFPLGQQLAYDDFKNRLRGPSPLQLNGKLSVETVNGRRGFIYEEDDVIVDIIFLEKLFDFLVELTHTYPEVITLGGDAVPALHQMASEDLEAFQPVARQLLYDIAYDTTRRLQKTSKELVCPRCLTYCASYDLRLGWLTSLTFYGCRTCRQSREFLSGSLVAILDRQMEAEQVESLSGLRVNWLRRRSLFDFSRVEIIQASDEDVERFAVQVGNDTDEWRKPRYEHMSCMVSAHCQLSENTLRILERMFGEVKVV